MKNEDCFIKNLKSDKNIFSKEKGNEASVSQRKMDCTQNGRLICDTLSEFANERKKKNRSAVELLNISQNNQLSDLMMPKQCQNIMERIASKYRRHLSKEHFKMQFCWKKLIVFDQKLQYFNLSEVNFVHITG